MKTKFGIFIDVVVVFFVLAMVYLLLVGVAKEASRQFDRADQIEMTGGRDGIRFN